MHTQKIAAPFGLLLVSLATCSCHKDNTTSADNGIHRLGIPADRIIKINQAVTVYDSTTLTNPDLLNTPPTNRTYEWTVTPANNAVSFGGSYQNGRADLIFNKPGTYQVTAGFYDTQHKLLGHTDTVTVEVTSDTLYPEQAIRKDDQLIITPSVLTNTPNGAILLFQLSSLRLYNYPAPTTQFIFSGDNHSFVFADSLKIASYPFAIGYGVTAKATQNILAGSFPVGQTTDISIVWLDKQYTGSVTFTSATQFTFKWDNTGAVIVNTIH